MLTFPLMHLNLRRVNILIRSFHHPTSFERLERSWLTLTLFRTCFKMARLPPNRASKNRITPTQTRTNTASSGTRTSSFYSTSRVSGSANISEPTATPERQRATAASSISTCTTPCISREPAEVPVIPTPPQSRPAACLTPLNLNSVVNRVDTTASIGENFMAKVEAFIESQQHYNDRLEQRLAEQAKKGRELTQARRNGCPRN